MMRVPGSERTLLEAKAAGADVRIVYSPLDALRLAREEPDREVVFFAIGFETTAPSTALTLRRAKAEGLENFSCFCNHVTIEPPLRALLDSPDLDLDGFIGPGHVATIIGADAFDFVAAEYGKPLVVSGFEPLDVLRSVEMIMRQLAEGRCAVENQYGRVVAGSRATRRRSRSCPRSSSCGRHFEWRGLGFITTARCGSPTPTPTSTPSSASSSPASASPIRQACQCGDVLKGTIKPWECRVFGTACTPEHAIGTCMVSPEGACAAYYNYGRHSRQRELAG